MIRIDNTKTNATRTVFTVIDETSQNVIHGCYASCCDTFSDATDITSHATMREQCDTMIRLMHNGYVVRYNALNDVDVKEFRGRVEAAR